MTAPTSSEPGQPRPLAHAYIRAHLLMTENELADVKERLAYYCHTEGLTLGKVFVERIDLAPAAYHALVDALEHDDAHAVLVPSLHHLAVLGPPTVLRDHLQRVTGLNVVVAAP